MEKAVNEIRLCEVCGSMGLESVLDLGSHPMCDDLVPVDSPRSCREYPIEILFCDVCLTAHQRFQVPKEDLFPRTYHYRSRFTADVLNGMAELVDGYAKRFGGCEGKAVLDVGCNDGSLLSIFKARGASKAFGIEPTDASLDARAAGHTILNDYLTPGVAQAFVAAYGRPDVITFTNVFAHIEDLSSLLEALKILMAPETVVVIENHYLGSVLDGGQFDTFYHEHPRTYSARSFRYIAKGLGAKLLDFEFPRRYGGNIRVYFGKNGTETTAEAPGEVEFGREIRAMSEKIFCWKENKTAELTALVEEFGPVAAKAFPGRAAILMKLLAIDPTTISAIYEKPGSLKIGHYAPGTRIEIRSDDELFRSDVQRPIVNLAWHIPGEIRGYLEEHGWKGRIIDILCPVDLKQE